MRERVRKSSSRKEWLHMSVSLVVVVALIVSVIVIPAEEAEASIYTPFGGKVEAYKEQSDASCVKQTCGPINKMAQNAVRVAIEPAVASVTAAVSATLSATGIGILAIPIAVGAIQGAKEAFIRGINVCSVEEIKVGPPRGASVGILKLGRATLAPNIPALGRITIIDVSLSDLLNVSVLDPKIYDYGNYKNEGSWVLGNSLNVLEVCGLPGDSRPDSGIASICNVPFIGNMLTLLNKGKDEVMSKEKEVILDEGGTPEEAQAAADKAGVDFANNCPFLNLLHQIGTSK